MVVVLDRGAPGSRSGSFALCNDGSFGAYELV